MSPDSDQLSIDTPELVAIEMPLAGIGSRFIALVVDYLLLGAGMFVAIMLFVILAPALAAFNQLSFQWATALMVFLVFLFNWGYFTLFEAFWKGRTPGKKVAKIRVIQRSGRPIGIIESMARNLVRFIDQLPGPYAVGVVTMFLTRQHQRLGDLAAGTLVVLDREQESPMGGLSGSRTITAAVFPQPEPRPEAHTQAALPVSGIAKLSASDLEVLEGFFARRLDMPMTVRESLAARMAAAIRAKSGLEQPDGMSTETFLEAAARGLRDVARMK